MQLHSASTVTDRSHQAGQRRREANGPCVSVVIPTLNEERLLPRCLVSCRQPGVGELIVPDGGSEDATRLIARSFGARVVEGPPGRAGQLNRGAGVAGGDVILFLHADCLLGRGAVACLLRRLRRDRHVGGWFEQRYEGRGVGFATLGFCANLRAWLSGVPYGDQGLFVWRDAFLAVGGFPDLPVMEDVALAWRLSRSGRLLRLPRCLVSSGRRFVEAGLVRQWARHVVLRYRFDRTKRVGGCVGRR